MRQISRFVTSSFIAFIFGTNTFASSANAPTDSSSLKVGNMVFISGQGGGTIGVPDNNGAALKESLESIRQIAKANGGSLKDIVKLDVYLSDLPKDFSMLNTIEAEYFNAPYPTRTVVGAVIPKNHTVEINAIMIIQK
jgi:enamine deaminase RidA (YjgF/YER057c/UK114 family)